MKHFTINAENNITVHASRKAARETKTPASFPPKSSSPTSSETITSGCSIFGTACQASNR